MFFPTFDDMANKESDLKRLRRKVENTLSWGEATSWHSKMFDELSEKVFEKTQVMLSVATLKRFFGVVKHEGDPSITTLDALSQFIGESNWTAFKTSKKSTRSFPTPNRSVYVTIGFILAVVTISLLGSRRPELVINASEFEFSSKVLSKEYPNSVVFDFKIPNTLRTDSLVIQQYWDPTKTIKIKKGQTQATGIYYFPGYFRAKLLAEGKEAQSHDLFLKSEGWLGMIEFNPVPKYFDPLLEGKKIGFPESILEEVELSDDPLVTSYHFIDDLGNISGDNFDFQTTVSSAFGEKWASCQSVYIFFIGSTGAMIIPFSKIGCSSDNNLMLNDRYLSGKEHDLSAFSADLSSSVDLGMTVTDQTMLVTIDGNQVYEGSYDKSMGRLVGVRFKFVGVGQVESFELKNQLNDVIL